MSKKFNREESTWEGVQGRVCEKQLKNFNWEKHSRRASEEG